jgi:YcxB-like protein
MESIQVEFTFTADIFWKAQRYLLWSQVSKGIVKWIFLAAIAALTLSCCLSGDIGAMVTYLVSIALFGGLWWVFFRWMSRRNFNKMEALQHPIHYTFSSDNIQVNSKNSQSVLQWGTFKKAAELPELFMLQQNHLVMNPVLKSGFRSEQDMQRFRELLVQKALLTQGKG